MARETKYVRSDRLNTCICEAPACFDRVCPNPARKHDHCGPFAHSNVSLFGNARKPTLAKREHLIAILDGILICSASTEQEGVVGWSTLFGLDALLSLRPFAYECLGAGWLAPLLPPQTSAEFALRALAVPVLALIAVSIAAACYVSLKGWSAPVESSGSLR